MQNSTRPNKPELDATKVPNEIDIAWAAGIYEGEGHCRLCGHTKRGFMVQIVQKDPELLYRLRDWFGGSVSGVRKGNSCHSYDICGDRARIFIALVYKFMTVRRKAQIDATETLDFLGSHSSMGLNAAQIRSQLDGYYQDHTNEVKKRVKVRKQEQYRRYAADPKWKKKDQQKKAEKRVHLTSEELELERKNRHERYLRKKQELHLVEMKKTA
jgi:hypothetical protein